MSTPKIYAVCRHYQDSDSDGYYQWIGNQILSYHKTHVGALKEQHIHLEKEIAVSDTSSASEHIKELTRNNQVGIFDGVGSNGKHSIQPLYHIVTLDLKP